MAKMKLKMATEEPIPAVSGHSSARHGERGAADVGMGCGGARRTFGTADLLGTEVGGLPSLPVEVLVFPDFFLIWTFYSKCEVIDFALVFGACRTAGLKPCREEERGSFV